MIRLLIWIHRYLGIAVGVLMVMWCLSGVVMMYVSYPALDEGSRLVHLTPIVWSGCCRISDEALGDEASVEDIQLEMLVGRPVVRLHSGRTVRLIDLTAGAALAGVSSEQAAAIAQRYASAGGVPREPRLLGMIDKDQWTVSGEFSGDRPVYRFSLNDAQHTEVYVSSVTGEAVQRTTGRERFWNWLGAVPHWLYFTELRRHAQLWRQAVIAVSLVGCFLAGTGLYIGVRQWIRRPAGGWSPYRGFNLWHHMAGLVFGLFALTWILSGLLSMNPWGLLEGAGAGRERASLRGVAAPSGAQIKAAIRALAAAGPAGVVSVVSAPLDGRLYFIASSSDGGRRRLDASGVAAPLNQSEIAWIARSLGAGVSVGAAPTLMTSEDDYYFGHHREAARLPVYRMILRDGTRHYLDPVSGMLVAKMDRDARGYRWLHEGLHRMDFTAALRGRPQWDVLMLLLMSGVTVLCVSGAYLGFRRVMGRR
jgi:uncharacterized iron-regulated membrane protein